MNEFENELYNFLGTLGVNIQISEHVLNAFNNFKHLIKPANKIDNSEWLACWAYISIIDTRFAYGLLDSQIMSIDPMPSSVSAILKTANCNIGDFLDKMSQLERLSCLSGSVLQHLVGVRAKVECLPLFETLDGYCKDIFKISDEEIINKKKTCWCIFLHTRERDMTMPELSNLLLCCLCVTIHTSSSSQLHIPYDTLLGCTDDLDQSFILKQLCLSYQANTDIVTEAYHKHFNSDFQSLPYERGSLNLEEIVESYNKQHILIGDINELDVMHDHYYLRPYGSVENKKVNGDVTKNGCYVESKNNNNNNNICNGNFLINGKADKVADGISIIYGFSARSNTDNNNNNNSDGNEEDYSKAASSFFSEYESAIGELCKVYDVTSSSPSNQLLAYLKEYNISWKGDLKERLDEMRRRFVTSLSPAHQANTCQSNNLPTSNRTIIQTFTNQSTTKQSTSHDSQTLIRQFNPPISINHSKTLPVTKHSITLSSTLLSPTHHLSLLSPTRKSSTLSPTQQLSTTSLNRNLQHPPNTQHPPTQSPPHQAPTPSSTHNFTIQQSNHLFQLGTSIYLDSLTSLISMEKGRVSREEVSALLRHPSFHACLLSCALEVVLFVCLPLRDKINPNCLFSNCYNGTSNTQLTNNTNTSFPWIIHLFGLKSFDFFRVINNFIKSKPMMPDHISNHLKSIETSIVSCLAWKSDSPLLQILPASKNPSTVSFRISPSVERNLQCSPRRLKSVSSFLSRVRMQGTQLIRRIATCLHLPDDIVLKICTCLDFCLQHKRHLFIDRHLDQVVMCCMYGVARVLEQSSKEVKFKQIIQAYKASKNPSSHTLVRNVKLEENNYGTVITFYNQVFVQEMKEYLCKRLQDNISSQPAVSTASPSEKTPTRILNLHNITLSPLRSHISPFKTSLTPRTITHFRIDDSPIGSLRCISKKDTPLEHAPSHVNKKLKFEG